MSSWNGTIVAIHVVEKEGGTPRRVKSARAIAGKGLEGDRYWAKAEAGEAGTYGQVTLIESESLGALSRDHGVELTGAESRRNILTAGVPLNHLVDREFRVGECVFRGRELSEPCGYLESKTRKGVCKGLIHRGGLRADIVSGGTLRDGDPITSLD